MTKNPFLNVLIAIAYISAIVSLVFYGPNETSLEPSIIIPITMLSLFVFSAAFMGLTFFYNPIKMYLDGDKKGSVSLLAKTVGAFAVVVALLGVTLLIFR